MSSVSLKDLADSLSQRSLQDIANTRCGKRKAVSGWTLDYSRQFLDDASEDALLSLANDRNIPGAIRDMFDFVHINPSEDRPATHWALRSPGSQDVRVESIRSTLDPALAFAEKVRTEKTIKTVLHLGIGGSDFGPRLLYDAAKDHYPNDIEIRFAANVDPLDLDRALSGLDPATTLIIGVSKSFSSEETMYNLERTRDWAENALGATWPDHFALVTASPEKAVNWLGRDNGQIFDMPVSVGGRFSLWSNASLACMIALGRNWFSELLAGAHEVDQHIQTAALEDNLPLQLALLDYWNMTCRETGTNIVLAYSNALRMLPTYLQQLELESNGKTVRPDGSAAPTRTIGALWGGEGTIGQHSYHQWLHQGSADVSVEFIVTLDQSRDTLGNTILLSHAFAQAEVLANGLSAADIRAENPDMPPEIVNQKVMPGGKPSIMLMTPAFSASALGSLIAIYEHRTFFAGRLWEINSFDQWGVERGKVQAGKIKNALINGAKVDDPITTSLIEFFSQV